MSAHIYTIPPLERQNEVLVRLQGGAKMGKELADDFGISETQISLLMTDLCRAGLVRKGFSLTQEGRRKVKRLLWP